MFTVEQIKEQLSKMSTGADFPAFIQAIKKLGVTHYETIVANGNTYYYGNNGYSCSSGPGYEPLSIAGTSNKVQFKLALEAHQQGKTSFVVFCNDCARLGIERWVVCTEKMTCTYFNKAGQELLVEPIPG